MTLDIPFASVQLTTNSYVSSGLYPPSLAGDTVAVPYVGAMVSTEKFLVPLRYVFPARSVHSAVQEWLSSEIPTIKSVLCPLTGVMFVTLMMSSMKSEQFATFWSYGVMLNVTVLVVSLASIAGAFNITVGDVVSTVMVRFAVIFLLPTRS